jgi:hypothetical protein
VVADDALSLAQRAERGDYVGCIAGALSFTEYREGLEAAGFVNVEITPTHPVADGMHSAIIRATKPQTETQASQTSRWADACCGANACCTPAETSANPDATVTEAKTASGCGCQN